MKVKLRLDKESLKTFFVGNVEKIVFGLIVIGCGVIIFTGGKAFKEPLPTPNDLQALAGRAEANVEGTVRGQVPLVPGMQADRLHGPCRAQRRPGQGRGLPAAQHLEHARCSRRRFRATSPRSIPCRTCGRSSAAARSPVRRPAAGSAPAAMSAASVGSWSPAQSPTRNNSTNTIAVFKPAVAYDPRADVPVYKGYAIERAEVGSGTELEWKEIDVDAARKRAVFLGNPLADTLEQKYLDPTLVFPLPPLATQTMGPGGPAPGHHRPRLR